MGNGRNSNTEDCRVGFEIHHRQNPRKEETLMGCKVKVTNRGFLAFRLHYQGWTSWEGTEYRTTTENRKEAQNQARIISAEMKARKFDYLAWFPEGNRAEQFRPKEEPPKTIGEYYRMWILRTEDPSGCTAGIGKRLQRPIPDLHPAKVRNHPHSGPHAGITRGFPELSPTRVRSAHTDKKT